MKTEHTPRALAYKDMQTLADRMRKKVVPYTEKLTVVDAYAISKAMYEKKLTYKSEVMDLLRHGNHTLDTVIDRFDDRDWSAIMRGETEYTPIEEA